MSRGTLRFVVVIVVLAGGLAALAPSTVEAAGREVRDPGFWSQVVEWVEQVWREEVFGWEMEGWMLDPNGLQGGAPEGEGGDEGWMLDPNG